MQISKIFYFVLILHLILGKVTKFQVEKLSTSEVISERPHGGCGWNPPPPSAFRVCQFYDFKKPFIIFHYICFAQMATSNIRYGPGVTQEVGMVSAYLFHFRTCVKGVIVIVLKFHADEILTSIPTDRWLR